MSPLFDQTQGGVLNTPSFAHLQQLAKLMDPVVLTGAADALDPHNSATYIPTKAGVDAMTLAAPTSGDDDGKIITIISGSAQAHTLTATALLNTGAAGTGLLTFASFKGATVILYAYAGKWNVISNNQVTVTS